MNLGITPKFNAPFNQQLQQRKINNYASPISYSKQDLPFGMNGEVNSKEINQALDMMGPRAQEAKQTIVRCFDNVRNKLFMGETPLIHGIFKKPILEKVDEVRGISCYDKPVETLTTTPDVVREVIPTWEDLTMQLSLRRLEHNTSILTPSISFQDPRTLRTREIPLSSTSLSEVINNPEVLENILENGISRTAETIVTPLVTHKLGTLALG